ncbi:LexA regulated protein [Marinomonas sp. M1K-6]|uniref:LexA regulated protein n=1 Tax=Marinomonas profundi TaxID=2726122 RepID=A0A847QVX2_9GAMM|nr:LexA regulated protein [Marinomonas profundi]NLQ16059.1 LexA regulated protein [Marinomonas profundi]UDV03353.1 LexA regulated protein [Marinomonas profundi]
MAKASSDRNTIDLFGKSPGRPRTQPLTRKDQLKLNKRAQREKAKAQGLKRLELIVEQDIIDKLDQLCELNDVKRAEWLTLQINKSLARAKTIKPKK